MSKKRADNLLSLILLGVVLFPLTIGGLWVYMTTTAVPLHPNPQSVSSVAPSEPLPKWAASVAQGRQIVRASLSEQNLPGLSVAVAAGGAIVWAEGFGWADVEKRTPIAPETRFRIGTASTMLTSAAAGLLLERGRLKLDDAIQKHVPAFPAKPWPVTLRHLMGHVGGVRTDSGDEGPLFSERCERPVEALEHFGDRSLLFEPGTQFRYSSYGWILMSAAIEAAGGEPFFTFMQKQVFEPLGILSTTADLAIEPIANQATSYFPRFAGDPRYGLDLMRELNYSCYAGSSAFLSTPSDLVRFGMAMQNGKLLQPATVQLLQTKQQLASEQTTDYGLGWHVKTVALAGEQTRVVGHDGELLGGMVASLLSDPKHGIVVAVISNSSYADTPPVTLKIAQSFVEQAKESAGTHLITKPPSSSTLSSGNL